MGRYGTSQTTESVMRLNISQLMQKGLIVKNSDVGGVIRWNNDAKISFESKLHDNNGYLRVFYKVTKRHTGEVTDYDYKIFFTSIPSNLGRGRVLYFVCPVSGRACKVLYMADGYERFTSREAYQHRIYYESQSCSKVGVIFHRRFQSEERYKALQIKREYSTYKGHPTNRATLRDAAYKRWFKYELLCDDVLSEKYEPFL